MYIKHKIFFIASLKKIKIISINMFITSNITKKYFIIIDNVPF